MVAVVTHHGKPNGGIGTGQILLRPSRIVKKVGKISSLETSLPPSARRRIRLPETRIGTDAKRHNGEGCVPHRLSEMFESGNQRKHGNKKLRIFWLWIKGRSARLGRVRAPDLGTYFRGDVDRAGRDRKGRSQDFRRDARRTRDPFASGRE